MTFMSFLSDIVFCAACAYSSRLLVSVSAMTVQYRSALMSVMIRIVPNPIDFIVLLSSLNFSTIGLTWPGLQCMTSRMRYILPPYVNERDELRLMEKCNK